MALEKATNSGKPTAAKPTSEVIGSFDSADSRDAVFANIEKSSNRATLHKSFDFSNAALFATNGSDSVAGFDAHDNASFRRFHQMTIYIDAVTRSHGNASKKTMMITSNLPESIQYNINSTWEAPLNFGNATTNLLMQMAVHNVAKNVTSSVHRATTMKIWSGSSPLSLSLKIPVIDEGGSDTRTNLVEALEVLGSLALPSLGGVGFYSPPPSPLNLRVDYATGINSDGSLKERASFDLPNSNHGRIMVQLGGILLIDHCVIDGFSVNYPNTKAMIRHDYAKLNQDFGVTNGYYLHPVLAEVTINISTIEAMTSDYYSQMLWAKPQNTGTAVADLSTGIAGYITGGAMEAFNGVKKLFGG